MTVSASSSGRGHRPTSGHDPNHPAKGPAAVTSAAVATTDSANPSETESDGDSNTSSSTHEPTNGKPRGAPPRTTPSRATAPMAPALITLGCGPTNTTYPSSATAAMRTCTRRGQPSSTASKTTAPTTIVTFPPDTAVRWDSPERCITSANCGSCRDSSPMARPATRLAGSSSASARAVCSPCRSGATAAIAAVGGDSNCAPLAFSTARLCPGSRAANRPATPTSLPTGCPANVLSPKTRTGSDKVRDWPRSQ